VLAKNSLRGTVLTLIIRASGLQRSRIMVEELLAQFVRDTHCVLANVDESYRMADGLTLDAYLALNDAERDALWQQAIQEAHDAGARQPERDIPAHYMPAGQKHRARRVRGKS